MVSLHGHYQASYTCRVCGADRTVAVRFRATGEDIVAWLDNVVRPVVTEHHRAAQPACPSEHCDLKLPAPAGSDGIGCPVKQ